MARINRSPRGFLGFLDAKSGGRTPGELPESLALTLDMTGFYAADLELSNDEATQAGIAAAGRGNAIITVPTGEQWLLYAAASDLFLTAGGGLSVVQTEIRGRGSAVRCPVASQQVNILTVPGAFFSAPVVFPEPLLLGSGAQVSTAIGLNPGTVTAVTHVLFRRSAI